MNVLQAERTFRIFWTLTEVGEQSSALLSNSYMQEAEDLYSRVSAPVSCSGGSEIQHCSNHRLSGLRLFFVIQLAIFRNMVKK
jgi:hypothetical protein